MKEEIKERIVFSFVFMKVMSINVEVLRNDIICWKEVYVIFEVFVVGKSCGWLVGEKNEVC
jgi:hypothetical protein